MIYVLLEGHNTEHEIFELIRMFYEDNKIKFINDKALVDNQSLLIVNKLINDNDKLIVETKLFKDEKLLCEDYINDVNDIKIIKNDINKKVKVALKQSILKVITRFSNFKVPWGVLTGIRPTKIVHELMDKGINLESIYNILTEEYLIAKDNAYLLLEIAKGERKYVFPMNENKFSLYVSIPFCPTRCVYCSFPSHSLDRFQNYVKDYVDNLIYEINEVGKLTKDKVIDTVYIGGGTPTSIPKEYLERIIKTIYKVFGNEISEFTVEAGRPDTINKEILTMLKENKVNRISINPQSMNNSTLSKIGRLHTDKEIIEAFKTAREVGFDCINMDIIVGLPYENTEDVKLTMNEIIKLNPENLTVHTMTIKKASKLREEISKYNLADQHMLQEMLDITKEYSKKMGMKPYYMYRQKQILGNFENVGYTKENKECIYNILMMEERQTIVAVGAGSVSKFFYPSENSLQRVPNVKGVKEYIERVEEMVLRKSKYI